MMIQTSTFTLHFPANPRIRESLFTLEEHFTDFQKPFTLVPLPIEAPMEIPRIIASTEHGHSQLIICGNNAQLITSFDDNFAHDVHRCIAYVRDKCSSIVAALSVIANTIEKPSMFYYSGISLNILLDKSDGIEAPTDYISQKFLKCKINLPVDEQQLRCALIVADKYYVNVMIQNYRQFAGTPDERGSLYGLKTLGENLQVTLDVNDRYAFNHEKGYRSSEEAVVCISELAERFSSRYVRDFVKSGEINYEQ